MSYNSWNNDYFLFCILLYFKKGDSGSQGPVSKTLNFVFKLTPAIILMIYWYEFLTDLPKEVMESDNWWGN